MEVSDILDRLHAFAQKRGALPGDDVFVFFKKEWEREVREIRKGLPNG